MPETVAEPRIEAGAGPSSDDGLAAGLRGFGPLSILAILVIILTGTVVIGHLYLPVGAVLVLVWARMSRTPWRQIGFARPRNWFASAAIGIVFGCAFKFLMKAVVMPLFGTDPINHAYHYLAGDQALIPSTLFAMTVSAGFGEETLFRGYMFERFGKLFGLSRGAKIAIVLITSIWFGLGHYQGQGVPGVEQALITGLAFGTIYAITGKIWIPMFAHAAFDLTAYWMIYWNLETWVAHLVFK